MKNRKEDQWTMQICELLKKELDNNIYEVVCFEKVPYSVNLNRYIKDKNLRKSFIDKSYEELNKTYKNWRNSHYIKTRNIIKRIIQKHKILVKIYTALYPKD